jgi:putative ABC transport system substrate-binding protein
MQATRSIPIVMVAYDRDPVAIGLVRSLAQPGGNVTGVFSRQPEPAGKRLELLKEMLPGLSTVAVLLGPGGERQLDALAAPARALGLRLQSVEVRDTKALEAAFRRAQRMKAQAVIVPFSPLLHTQRARIAALALDARLPTLCQEYDFVEAGALVSYAPDRDAILVRVAHFIDRLLKGAHPGDLPVERADTFKLAVNLRTAHALGVPVPESILLRANQVIR